MKNPPNFFYCIVILSAMLMLKLTLYAAFYEFGLNLWAAFYGAMIMAISLGIVVFMRINHWTYRQLIHPSKNSVTSTMMLLTPAVVLIAVGESGWLADLLVKINFLLSVHQPEDERWHAFLAQGPIALLLLCLVVPFLQEMFYRGIILRSMLHHYSPQKAIFLSSVLFALAHLNVEQFGVAFVGGIIYGWLFYVTRSLWPGILAHALYNAGCYFRGAEQWQFNNWSTNLLTFALMICGIVWVIKIYRVKRC